MANKLIKTVVILGATVFSIGASAADWLDLQPGEVYPLKANTMAKLICLKEASTPSLEEWVNIGPESGADINIRSIEVLSKETPSSIFQLNYILTVKSSDFDDQSGACHFEIMQRPVVLGGGGTDFSAI